MADKRPPLEQVKSGFRIAGTLLLGLSFFLALSMSVGFLTLRNNVETQGAHPIVGGLLLLLLSGILLVTTKVWSRWLFAILAYCAAKLFFAIWLIALGSSTRLELKGALLLLMFLALSVAGTLKFIQRPPSGAERVGLVGLLICLIFALEYQSWEAWVTGLAILAAGHTIHFFKVTRKLSHVPKHSFSR